jgi:hypothetical protein
MALRWMQRLRPFRPHLGGAVWRGTATRLSAVFIDLYCDDPKSAEIELLNQGITTTSGRSRPRTTRCSGAAGGHPLRGARRDR